MSDSSLRSLIMSLRQQNMKRPQVDNDDEATKTYHKLHHQLHHQNNTTTTNNNNKMMMIPRLLVKPKPDTVAAQASLALNRASRASEAQQLLRCVVQWEHVCAPLWKALAGEANAENQRRNAAFQRVSIVKQNESDVTPAVRLLAAQAQHFRNVMRQEDASFQLSYEGYKKTMAEVDQMRQDALARLDPIDRIDVAMESTIAELEMQREHLEAERDQNGGGGGGDSEAIAILSDKEIHEQAAESAASLRGIYRTTNFPDEDDRNDQLERNLLRYFADFLPKVDAALFMSCPRQAKTGTIDVRILYELLQVQIAVTKFAAEMLLMDEVGERTVSVEQLEAYVEDTLPGIPGFQNILRRQIVDVFKTVQVERFVWQQQLLIFDSSSNNKNNSASSSSSAKLDLKSMLATQDLRDMLLHQLKPEELTLHPSEGIRWFACGTTMRLYDDFNRLDQRRKRLLCLGDFRKYRRVLLTNNDITQHGVGNQNNNNNNHNSMSTHPQHQSSLPPDVSPLSFSFIKRYFECVPNFNNEMDFRCYVQFILMVESLPEKCPRAGVFFDIFDADGAGVLTPTRMSRFMIETRTKLSAEFDSYGATAERQVDDLFHLIKCKVPYEITRKEFMESVNNGLFCALAIDCEALLTYEQRDWTNPKLKQEELMQRPFSGRR